MNVGNADLNFPLNVPAVGRQGSRLSDNSWVFFLIPIGLADDYQHPYSTGNSDEVSLKSNMPVLPSQLHILWWASPESFSMF